MRHPFSQGGLVLLRENILNGHGRELVGACATLCGILIPNRRVNVTKDTSERARTDRQGLLVVVHCAFGFGHSLIPSRLGGNCVLRLIPLREFNERRKPAARSRKSVKNIRNVLRVELKLPGSKRQPEAVVNFGSLAFREILS
jgi:hypothetical protein